MMVFSIDDEKYLSKVLHKEFLEPCKMQEEKSMLGKPRVSKKPAWMQEYSNDVNMYEESKQNQQQQGNRKNKENKNQRKKEKQPKVTKQCTSPQEAFSSEAEGNILIILKMDA